VRPEPHFEAMGVAQWSMRRHSQTNPRALSALMQGVMSGDSAGQAKWEDVDTGREHNTVFRGAL